MIFSLAKHTPEGGPPEGTSTEELMRRCESSEETLSIQHGDTNDDHSELKQSNPEMTSVDLNSAVSPE